MTRLAPLLVACLGSFSGGAAPSGDKEAESLFARALEKVTGARTVRIVCAGTFRTPGFEADVNATLTLKQGNKMTLDLDTSGFRDGKPHSYQMKMISDGS